MEDWKVIVSSKSGSGKTRKAWPEISKLLEQNGISYSVSFTEYKSHAIDLAREAVLGGYRKILAVGGDGAIHEILNGVFSQDSVPTSEVTLAIVPVGSGNDWARMHHIPKEREEAVRILAKNTEMVQDVAFVTAVKDGVKVSRYMMNIGGVGYDAQVCHDYDKAKVLGHFGDAVYFECLVKGFFCYKPHRFVVSVDDGLLFEGKALSVAFGNGKYCGGGMMQTPDAEPNDGLVNVTVIGTVSKASFFKNVKGLYSGAIYDKKEVVHSKGHIIKVESSPSCYLEVDGEYIGDTPVSVEIIPSAIKVITNKELYIK